MTAGRKTVLTQPTTRRERRASERAERAAQRNRPSSTPFWRSPIFMFTAAALALGAAVIVYAVGTQPAAPTDTLKAPAAVVPAALADGRSLGSASAPVTIEVWSDFQCPGCRQLATLVEPPVISRFVVPGYARLVYHDAAFQGQRASNPWDESVAAAAGARCAADQGRFWQMHDWLFANWNGENEGAFRQDRLRAIAQSAEIDMATYDTCMAAGDKQAAARAETKAGVAAGIQSTPTILLNGQRYSGPVTVAAIADAIMAAAGGASPAPEGMVTSP